jgi:hypothetical protein
MIGYCAWRFLVEFIKPHNPADLYLGLSAIQITSAITCAIATVSLIDMRRAGNVVVSPEISPPPQPAHGA